MTKEKLSDDSVSWYTTTSFPWGVLPSFLEPDYPAGGLDILPVKSDIVGRLITAKRKMDIYIENLPLTSHFPKTNSPDAKWRKLCQKEQATLGEESLRTLFPENIYNRNISIFTRTLSSLRREGIETRSKLIDTTTEDLFKIRNIGQKSMEIIILLKDIIFAEREQNV